MATKVEILNCIEKLTQIYGKAPETLDGYYWALEEIPAAMLEKAVRQAAKTSVWMPKPAELRKLAEQAQDEFSHAYPADTFRATWIEMWRNYWHYGEFDSDDARDLIQQLENLGRVAFVEEVQRKLKFIESRSL